MIKVRRIGHATFETPDLDRQIDYYTQVNGLALVAREKSRAFLATKTGQLVVQLERAERARCAKISFEVAPNENFADMARRLSGRRHQERAAQRQRARHAQGARVPGPQGNDHRGFQRMEFSRPRSAGRRRWPAQARPHRVPGARSAGDHRILLRRARLSRVRLDRRFLFLPALRAGPPFGELHPRQEGENASHRLRAEGLRPPADRLRTAWRARKSRSSGARGATARATTSSPITATRTTRWSSSTPSSTR